ncbi:FadR/GntR family transcriptional regulator [Streptacidiphilus jiangxiensis]|uniref:FadR/GntR family transcriptional regulator n=1 Tax=Streptacidiphilus jiangxiensis TaxID=235985 RepID=UPI00191C6C4E|nr:GntR family transcriptional regulator [Streptacidiphilus jiangxiensis]
MNDSAARADNARADNARADTAPAAGPRTRLRREPVSDQLFTRLRSDILGGVLPPGDPFPSERELSEEYGVNRHAVREAVKRLQQARLVEVAHGGRTRVLDWRHTAGLDLLVDLPEIHGAAVSPAVLERDTVELRACIGADAARLCALRATPDVVAAITEAAAHYAEAGPDLNSLGEADVAWWRLIIEGSGNLAYLLAFNTLLAGALISVETPPLDHRAGELLDAGAHIELARLIASGDAPAAHAHAHALLSGAAH